MISFGSGTVHILHQTNGPFYRQQVQLFSPYATSVKEKGTGRPATHCETVTVVGGGRRRVGSARLSRAEADRLRTGRG